MTEVILNGLQIATLNILTERAVNGLITADVAAEYKGNVLNALVRHGAIRTFHKGFKLNNVNPRLRPLSTPRASKHTTSMELVLADVAQAA